MSGHTRGPWDIETDHRKERFRIVGDDGRWVVGYVSASSPTDAANARLVAAAPELLQLLAELVAAKPPCAEHPMQSSPEDCDGCANGVALGEAKFVAGCVIRRVLGA